MFDSLMIKCNSGQLRKRAVMWSDLWVVLHGVMSWTPSLHSILGLFQLGVFTTILCSFTVLSNAR